MFERLFTRISALRTTVNAEFRAFESTLAVQPEAAQITARAPESVVYPYYVHRTRFQTLPVYSDIKNGKTRKLTLIRRIEGDIGALREELSRHLDDSSIQIKSISNQLVIKGDRTKEVREWLTVKGF
ncbi:mitochondrial large ribosomal subunit [Coemansia spiralis]|uniref:Large ribosomal subunit protein mL49 n=2 Tax=Coemansia TaxID=4863 RepID=A0A9W8G7G5_9FUNG|nr:mitochondrial large ribosomal subunit [Coemansia umbellata]KAJ2675963.1 mitochondrial large ribosomal subunit [Coemansia spiralis]